MMINSHILFTRTRPGTQVTTRQLEALIRLTQARAKVECQDLATGRPRLPISFH